MIALAFICVMIYTLAARLLMALWYPGLKNCTDTDLHAWLEGRTKAPAKLQSILEYVSDEADSQRQVEGKIKEVELGSLPWVDRSITILAVLVVASPLFGLLGTVSGMLLTFKAISLGGASVADIVAKGISEALVATQTGLMVAIPGWMLVSIIKRWRLEFASFLLRLESVLLRKHHRSDLLAD